MALTSEEHPLENAWSIWVYNPSIETSNWSDKLINAGTMYSIEGMWSHLNYLKEVDKIGNRGYAVFKSGIFPATEDLANSGGIKVATNVPPTKQHNFWLECVIDSLGAKQNEDIYDNLNGVFYYNKSNGMAKVEFWFNKNASRESLNTHYKKLLGSVYVSSIPSLA